VGKGEGKGGYGRLITTSRSKGRGKENKPPIRPKICTFKGGKQKQRKGKPKKEKRVEVPVGNLMLW